MTRLCALLLLLALPLHAQERLRLATFNVGLGRDGPGLLLKDILDRDADIVALAQIIGQAAPDVLLLTNFDSDFQNIALGRFMALIRAETGIDYRYLFAPLGNAGLGSGLDLNRNNRLGDWADNWGFGRFEGASGMALLSRYPLGDARVFDRLKWQQFGPAPTIEGGAGFYPVDVWPRLKLASHSLWDVQLILPNTALRLLAAHPTPPVFDGAENANGLRNAAEISFFTRYIGGEPFTDDADESAPLTSQNFVIIADLNADPNDGEGLKPALNALLQHPRLQDPKPQSDGASQNTVAWESAGNMRVDYVLPSAGLTVTGAGVFWPVNSPLLATAKARHRLVWVDIALPR